MEEEKARVDSENGYTGFWRNCQWVRSTETESAVSATEGAGSVGDLNCDFSQFGNDCQLLSSSGGSGPLVNYDSDSSCDTGMCLYFMVFSGY